VEGRKYITYDEWLERARDKCSHAFSAVCVNCAPPSQRRYKLDLTCTKHKPCPAAICLDCAPETVDLVPQPYRHVDNILINCFDDVASFINVVSANPRLHRGGVLYGRYAPDPNYRHGWQAIVEAVYEPPQVCDYATGAVRLLPDPHAAAVAAVAAAAGLRPVGWLFSRARAATGVELLPHELYAIAAAQLQHSPRPDGRSGSQWVALTCYHDASGDGQWHLAGYQATDQLVALVRDGVLAQPRAEDVKFRRREPVKAGGAAGAPSPVPGGRDLPVPDVLFKSATRGATRVDAFDPDPCLVTIEAGRPTPGSALALAYPPLFPHEASFPVENREALGVRATPAALRRLLTENAREPYEVRLGSFHALVYMARVLDAGTAATAAACVAERRPMEAGVVVLLEAAAAAGSSA